MTFSLSKEDQQEKFWQSWLEADFSWEGLLKRSIPADHVALRWIKGAPANLQAYWRSRLERGSLRTDEEMADELVTDPEGRLWHIAHVPLRWANGTPAKASWTMEQNEKLSSVISQRCAYSLSNHFDQAPTTRGMARLNGIVLPHFSFPQGKANAIFVHGYFGETFNILESYNENRFLNCYFAKQVSLINTKFHSEAIFENCVFENRVCALSVDVSETASFCGSVFFGNNIFRECRFFGKSSFHHATFVGPVDFDGSVFTKHSKFYHAVFLAKARFDGAVFDGAVDFDACEFSDLMSFKNARFNQPAFFTSNRWPTGVADVEASVAPLAESAFYNARFSDSAIFNETAISPLSALNGCLLDGGLHLDRIAEDLEENRFLLELEEARKSVDPDARLEALLGGCQTIRRAMERASDKKAEHLYYRFELMVRQRQRKTAHLEQILLLAYEHASKYGSSVSRPIVVIFILIALCGIIDGVALGFGSGSFSLERSVNFTLDSVKPMLHGLSFSISRVFPFGPWEIDANARSILIGSSASPLSICLRALATIQSLASLILFFLTALAVRRRFQIG